MVRLWAARRIPSELQGLWGAEEAKLLLERHSSNNELDITAIASEGGGGDAVHAMGEGMKLTIEMPWGKNLSVNHMRFGRAGSYRKKPEVQAWMETCHWGVRTVWNCPRDEGGLERAEWALPLRVTVDFRFPSARRTDDHNYFKCIADSVASGLGIDDQHIRISTGEVEIDRDNPGFTITVEDEG